MLDGERLPHAPTDMGEGGVSEPARRGFPVSIIQRTSVMAFAIALAASVSGCAIKFGSDGLCMKPLFKVNVELNRYEKDDGGHGEDCNCVGGEGQMIDGGTIDGGVTTTAPLMVQTEPLTGHPLTSATGGFLSSQTAANPAPVFGPNAGTGTGSPSSSTGNQETAKKRPGSLFVSTGLPMGTDGKPHDGVVRVGQKIVFGAYIKNTGDMPLDAFQLQGTFTPNLKPISVIRSSGPNENELRPTTSTARVEGQRVIFDRFANLGPDTQHEYQITAEVLTSGAGNFELTQLEGPAIKKNKPITAVAQ